MGAVDALTAVRGGNHRHDKDNDDAQMNVSVVPNGGINDGDRALFPRWRRRDDDRKTRRRRQ
jgi:hypothetical protein